MGKGVPIDTIVLVCLYGHSMMMSIMIMGTAQCVHIIRIHGRIGNRRHIFWYYDDYRANRLQFIQITRYDCVLNRIAGVVLTKYGWLDC